MDTGLIQPFSISTSTSLLSLLSNNLILYQIVPHLTPSSLLALGATSQSFKSFIYDTPGVFRHLDLRNVKSANFKLEAIDHGGEVWRNVQMDENTTEDDFYGGPLSGIFNKLRRQNIFHGVQTLILDGLSVTSDLVCDLILQPSSNVRILSLREVQNLNEGKLRQALSYAVRPTRAENTPKLQALYIFGARDPIKTEHRSDSPKAGDSKIAKIPIGSMVHSQAARLGAERNNTFRESFPDDLEKGDKWYRIAGKAFDSVNHKPPSIEWEATIRACDGIISFDAVLCRGPRHADPISHKEGQDAIPWYQQNSSYITPKAATSVVEGCSGCGSSPEGFSSFGKSPLNQLPLLAPPPLYSSTQRACKAPFIGTQKSYFFARCAPCLRNRFCESCAKWWCEDCYEVPDISSGRPTSLPLQDSRSLHDRNVHIKPGLKRSCFECGINCSSCIKQTQLMCKICCGGYCTIHNEGSSLTTCDWCATSGRLRRELY